MTDLSQRIREARKRLGLSQAEFAHMLKASQGSVSKWENGKEMPSVSTIFDIAAITGESAEALYLGTDERFGSSTTLVNISIVGQIEAEKFTEGYIWDRVSETYQIPVPNYISNLHMIGYLVLGNGGGNLFPDGSVALIITTNRYQLELRSGDVVLVLQKGNMDLVEVSLREYSVANDGAWLWPISKDPSHRQYALQADAEGSAVQIIGQVVGGISSLVSADREFTERPQPPRPSRENNSNSN